MAESGPRKKRSRLGARFQMEINFPDDESKKQFLSRLDKARNAATTSDSCPKVDNYCLLSMLLDRFEEARGTGDAAPVTSNTTTAGATAENRSMLKHSGIYFSAHPSTQITVSTNSLIGIYTGQNEAEDGEQFFICERETFYTLMTELNKPCSCLAVSHTILSVTQVFNYVQTYSMD